MHAVLTARRLRQALAVPLLLASAATVLGAAAGPAGAAAAATPCLAVTGVQPPSPGSQSNQLKGVAVLSACNAWAVGQTTNQGASSQALIEHWDGANWTVMQPPGPASAILNAVAARSATDVWAVGEDLSSGHGVALIEHWDGTAWSVLPSPAVTGGVLLDGVTATSATNAWAVGTVETGTSVQALVERWNGTAWSVVPSVPSPGGDTEPAAVTATSASNAWMVGGFSNPGTGDSTFHPFIEHWNGTAWTVTASPTLAGSFSVLNGVTATSASNAWAVGQTGTRSAPQTVIEHWNGSAWSPATGFTPAGGVLNAVAATGTGSGLAVGTSAGQSLMLRWDGSAWTPVPTPSLGTSSSLLAVAGPATSGNWSVGSFTSSTGPAQQAFALHCC